MATTAQIARQIDPCFPVSPPFDYTSSDPLRAGLSSFSPFFSASRITPSTRHPCWLYQVAHSEIAAPDANCSSIFAFNCLVSFIVWQFLPEHPCLSRVGLSQLTKTVSAHRLVRPSRMPDIFCPSRTCLPSIRPLIAFLRSHGE